MALLRYPRRTLVLSPSKDEPARVSFDRLRMSVLVWVLALSAITGAQQPVFRTGAQLTIVDVTVTDKSGRPIEGLTENDFAITEDGVPQTISLVAYQRVDGGDAGALPPLPPIPSRPPSTV